MLLFLQRGSYLLGWDQIREPFVSSVSSEAVIFRKVLQTLIIKCFQAFLKELGYKLWAPAEVLGMSRGQLFPLSPLLCFGHWG